MKLIWSDRHGLWWGPIGGSYCADVAQASLYPNDHPTVKRAAGLGAHSRPVDALPEIEAEIAKAEARLQRLREMRATCTGGPPPAPTTTPAWEPGPAEAPAPPIDESFETPPCSLQACGEPATIRLDRADPRASSLAASAAARGYPPTIFACGPHEHLVVEACFRDAYRRAPYSPPPAPVAGGDVAGRLSVWRFESLFGVSCWVATSAEDAARLFNETVDQSDDDAVGPDDFAAVADDHVISIQATLDRPAVAKTAAEWARERGRGFLAGMRS